MTDADGESTLWWSWGRGCLGAIGLHDDIPVRLVYPSLLFLWYGLSQLDDLPRPLRPKTKPFINGIALT